MAKKSTSLKVKIQRQYLVMLDQFDKALKNISENKNLTAEEIFKHTSTISKLLPEITKVIDSINSIDKEEEKIDIEIISKIMNNEELLRKVQEVYRDLFI